MVCHIVVAGNRAQRPTQTTLKHCRAAVRLEKIFKQPYNAFLLSWLVTPLVVLVSPLINPTP